MGNVSQRAMAGSAGPSRRRGPNCRETVIGGWASRLIHPTRRNRETGLMTTTPFDFTPLLAPGLPPAAAPWTGLSTYSFVGGNNDPDGVPLEGLIEAINAVLKRDGRALAT